MPATITAFFRTNTGAPATGLTPTIRIWQVQFGSPTDQLVVNNDAMLEVGDGFYKYEFTSYDPFAEYAFRADGGVSLTDDRRYVEGASECADPEEMWAVQESDATSVSGSIGESLITNQAVIVSNQTTILGNQTTIIANQATMTSLLQTLLKYDQNRTRIDPAAKTLTIYDNDGTTPLKVFDLKDSTGTPSVVEVCERDPQ